MLAAAFGQGWLPRCLLDAVTLLPGPDSVRLGESLSLLSSLIAALWLSANTSYSFRGLPCWYVDEMPPLSLDLLPSGALCQPQSMTRDYLSIGLMKAGNALLSLKAPDRGLGRKSMTSERLCVSMVLLEWWI